MRRRHKATKVAPQNPDCTTCIHREGCPNYAENKFCGKYASKNPEIRLPDPNDLWRRGEEVEF